MARRRGRNPAIWFFLGVVLGVIALIVLYFLPQKKTLATAGATPMQKAAIPISSNEEISEKPPEKLWYYLDSEKAQFGPMSFYALQEAWDDDKITASTYIWNEDMENWVRLENLIDLHARIRRAP
jgi:hypothetical protein